MVFKHTHQSEGFHEKFYFNTPRRDYKLPVGSRRLHVTVNTSRGDLPDQSLYPYYMITLHNIIEMYDLTQFYCAFKTVKAL